MSSQDRIQIAMLATAQSENRKSGCARSAQMFSEASMIGLSRLAARDSAARSSADGHAAPGASRNPGYGAADSQSAGAAGDTHSDRRQAA